MEEAPLQARIRELEEALDKIRSIVKCAVCQRVVRSPALQCQAGHTCCTQCVDKVPGRRCIICRSSIPVAWNKAIEKVGQVMLTVPECQRPDVDVSTPEEQAAPSELRFELGSPSASSATSSSPHWTSRSTRLWSASSQDEPKSEPTTPLSDNTADKAKRILGQLFKSCQLRDILDSVAKDEQDSEEILYALEEIAASIGEGVRTLEYHSDKLKDMELVAEAFRAAGRADLAQWEPTLSQSWASALGMAMGWAARAALWQATWYQQKQRVNNEEREQDTWSQAGERLISRALERGGSQELERVARIVLAHSTLPAPAHQELTDILNTISSSSSEQKKPLGLGQPY